MTSHRIGRDSRLFLVLIAIVVGFLGLLVWFVLAAGEDSWEHYQNGGIFPAGAPAFSDDGRMIFFASPQSGNGDIYSADLASGKLTRLTSSTECEIAPVFARASHRIYYNRESDGNRHIWRMQSDGTSQEQVTAGQFLDDVVETSDDGSYLIFSRSPRTLGAGRTVRYCALNVEKPDATPIEVGTTASFFPSTNRIAFNPVETPNEIWTLNLPDGRKSTISQGTNPRVSPNGHQLAVLEMPPNGIHRSNYGIVLIDLSENSRRLIAKGNSPRFLPDGSGIIYLQNYLNDLYFSNLDGSKTIKIDVPPVPKTEPAFSPDGAKCVIATLPNGSKLDRSEYVAYILDTKNWQPTTIQLSERSQ